jgi:hypothetical protein
MTYSSKTFKIKPMYRMLYQSCIDVVGQDKSPLMTALLEKEIGYEKALSLQLYDFNELFEKMVFSLKKEVYEGSYDDVEFFIHHHDRVLIVKEIFEAKLVPSNMTILSFRIPEVIVEEIHKLKRTTLGDVVELAIGLYLCRCDDVTFNLIKLSYETLKNNPFQV